MHAGNFNCQHVIWCHSTATPDGWSLAFWATTWVAAGPNLGTNPNMTFASVDHDNQPPERRVLGKILR